MRKTISLFVLLVLNVYYSSTAYGQDSTIVEPKNIIYATGGTLGLYYTANLNYERFVKTKDRKSLIKYHEHVGVGRLTILDVSGPTFVTSV
jgi:TRAP-type uncharacterized transport system substrate-binding protein